MAVTPQMRAEIDRYQAMLDEDPTSRAFAPLGELYRKADLLDQAIEVCEKGLKHHPNSATALVTLGRALLAKDDRIDDAQDALERAVELSPENLAGQRALARLHQRTGDVEAELQTLQRLEMMNPDDPDVGARLQELRGPSATQQDSGAVEESVPDTVKELAASVSEQPQASATGETPPDGFPLPPSGQTVSPAEDTAPASPAPPAQPAQPAAPPEPATPPEPAPPTPVVSSRDKTPPDPAELPQAAQPEAPAAATPTAPAPPAAAPPAAAPPAPVEAEPPTPPQPATSTTDRTPPEPVELPSTPPPSAPPAPAAADAPPAPVAPASTEQAASAPAPAVTANEDDPTAAPSFATATPRPLGPTEKTVEADPPIQTETMADLFMNQGHYERALAIYESLLRVDPGNQKLADKVGAARTALALEVEPADRTPSVPFQPAPVPHKPADLTPTRTFEPVEADTSADPFAAPEELSPAAATPPEPPAPATEPEPVEAPPRPDTQSPSVGRVDRLGELLERIRSRRHPQ